MYSLKQLKLKSFNTVFVLGLLVLGGTSGYAANNFDLQGSASRSFDSRGPDPRAIGPNNLGGGRFLTQGPGTISRTPASYAYSNGNFDATGLFEPRGYDQGYRGPLFLGTGPSGGTLEREMQTGMMEYTPSGATSPYGYGYRAPLSAQAVWQSPTGGGSATRNMITGRSWYIDPSGDNIATGWRAPTKPTVYYVQDQNGTISALSYDWVTGTSTVLGPQTQSTTGQ